MAASPSRARPQGCALGSRCWHRRPGSVCPPPGSGRVCGWLQGCGHTRHCHLLLWVPGTGVATQGFPMSFGHGSGQPVLLSLVSIRFQLKPNAFSSISCAAVSALPKMKQIPTDCNSDCSSIRAHSQCDHKTSSTKTNNPTKPHPRLTASSGMPLEQQGGQRKMKVARPVGKGLLGPAGQPGGA